MVNVDISARTGLLYVESCLVCTVRVYYFYIGRQSWRRFLFIAKLYEVANSLGTIAAAAYTATVLELLLHAAVRICPRPQYDETNVAAIDRLSICADRNLLLPLLSN